MNFKERAREEAEKRTADAPEGPIKLLAVMYRKGFNEGAEFGYKRAVDELRSIKSPPSQREFGPPHLSLADWLLKKAGME